MTEKRIPEAESWAVLVFAITASAVAVVWSWRHAAMLNYGDAVAHLHIARRVFDARTPRFTQLGSVWLPLPHILLIPFVQNYDWWATGLAAVVPSSLSYIASCAGIYRLARRWLSRPASVLALVFLALNPNLLYLQTTAMTEPLFLCETIWIVVWMVEWRAALDDEQQAASYKLPPGSPARTRSPWRLVKFARRPLRIFEAPGPQRGAWLRNPLASPAPRANVPIARTAGLQILIAAALVAAIFTRYDGWIIAFLVWSGVGITLLRRAAAGERGRLSSPAFWLASCVVIAAPILWFLYNSAGFGDWLYFARGPYSARAIELRTASSGAGPPHPGWHSPWVAFLYYIKVSLLDSVAARAWSSLWGNIVLALAAIGTAAFSRGAATDRRRASAWILLLWLPVPFYAWSVAYGSVPIFFPAWWPFTWYNTRYGLELLPALALGLGLAVQLTADALRRIPTPRLPSLLPNLAFTLFGALALLNVDLLLRSKPIVYVESTKNADARRSFDDAIPPALGGLLSLYPHAPLLMNTSAYPEIVAFTGIPLRQTINESDLQIFRSALAAPAAHAAIVLAFDGDEVDRAVKNHPEGLVPVGYYEAPGQPAATLYLSSTWIDRIKPPQETPGP